MGLADQESASYETERLRQALDAETRRCLDVQREMERAKAEFEEFISTAAHNIRESLRGVASYSQLLSETHSGQLDSDSILFLARIQDEAARMQSMLADIVDYWATSTRDRPSIPTDMEAVLRQAFLHGEGLITARNAIVTHDPLPKVLGEPIILTKVLNHLIKNAIEYCVETVPRVHISSRREQDNWACSVEDNGCGVDPAFHGRLFGLFKRLHGKEHPGNGLGLAFCKKSIEGLGGRIWMESSPPKGSKFYFSLPAAE